MSSSLDDMLLDESESESAYDSEEGELHYIRRSRKEPLGLTGGYAPDWGLCEGFREIFQNWRDGILRAFNIDQRDFKPRMIERKRLVLIEVFHPTSKDLMGYIRFKYDKEEKGTLELTNFDASLELQHLSLGGTTKSTDESQAGQHGEGLKMAALVFRRSGNHNFRILSSCFSWNFNFDKWGKLNCTLTRINKDKIKKQKESDEGKARTTTARAYQDVCVMIGDERKARNRWGNRTSTVKIPLAGFREWLKVSLDLQSPTSIIKTNEGDIIMDPVYNNLYLRGLLLPYGSSTGCRLHYGYNILRGKTNRDRQSIAGSKKESLHIMKTWALAIRNEAPDTLANYTELLLTFATEIADVMVNSEDLCLEKDMAHKVWQHMLNSNLDEHGQPRFYYSADASQDNIHIITHNLKRSPVPIRPELWKIFSKFDLCRTPTEEQYHIFSTAQVVRAPSNDFAQHIDWMLECCLRARPSTQHLQLEFVEGQHLALDSILHESKWRIHEKWLTYDGAHKDTYCDDLLPVHEDLFCCDHVVLWLWDLLIADAIASDNKSSIARDHSWLKSIAQTRLKQVPRRITCQRTDHRGELIVTWEIIDSYRNKDEPMRVTLHAAGCTDATEDSPEHPVNFTSKKQDLDLKCECPSEVAPAAADLGITFKGLDPSKKYLAKVSRDYEGAFFGLAPKEIHPNAEAMIKIEQNITSGPEVMSDRTLGQDGGCAGQPDEDITTSEMSHGTPMFVPSDDDDDSLYQEPSRAAPEIRSEPDPERGNNENAAGWRRRPFWTTRLQRAEEPPTDSDENPKSPQAVEPTPAPPTVAHRPQNADTQEAVVSEPSSRVAESYELGELVNHNDLAWGDGFPGSHDFYRTRDHPDKDVLIAKPKDINANGKRAGTDTGSERPDKRRT